MSPAPAVAFHAPLRGYTFTLTGRKRRTRRSGRSNRCLASQQALRGTGLNTEYTTRHDTGQTRPGAGRQANPAPVRAPTMGA